MTTSGVSTFSMSQIDIITDALSIIRVLGLDESLQDADINLCSRALNRVVKYFENEGLHLWKKSEGVLFLQPFQNQYVLGAGSPDNAALASSVVNTTLMNPAVTGATSIVVTTATGLTIGANIGIILTTNVLFWTTITGITGTTLTLNSALTGNANANLNVYTYTTAVNKPLDVWSIRRRQATSFIDTPLVLMAYEDYQNLPTKVQGPAGTTTSASTPVQWTYNRDILNGSLFIWPVSYDQSYFLMFTYAEPLQDISNASNTPDFPVEWYDALVYQLAIRLAPMYGKIGTAAFQQLKMMADEFLAKALSFDNEETYVKFTIDTFGDRGF